MTQRAAIFTYISSLLISLVISIPCKAQNTKLETETVQADSISLIHGFAVSVDLVGAIQRMVSDYGQYEAAIRLNLRDTYFPVLEVGIGSADHNDDVSQTRYKSSAPYFRIGADYNLMNNKHDIYRIYGGIRYAFTYFNYDLSHPDVVDPIWGDIVPYSANNVKCNYHWAEISAGVDATLFGPLHLGWSVRYRKRISHNSGSMGNVWYVPGFGISGGTRLGGTFNITIDI